jgi:mono/diheme cytochrome c family protein
MVALLAGCRTEQTLVTPDPHLERMVDQEKVRPYEATEFLPRATAMQQPPEGTLPLGASPATSSASRVGDHWATRIPIAVDRALVVLGRRQFETFCAACHGILGDGHGAVAERMQLRRPENLLDPDAREYPAGRVFEAIRRGYGLMPSYAVQLSERDSWAVVAYLGALQMARGIRPADLPADAKARLASEAP